MDKTNSNLFFIITVPHSFCIYFEGHTCDFYAEITAKYLFSQLSDNYNTYLITADINRVFIDMNRIESRNTEFRKKIRNIFNNILKSNSKKKIIFILDCHSFPVENNTIYHFGTVNIPNPKITILYNNSTKKKYAELLVDLLNKNNLDTTILPGIDNDIINEYSFFEDENTLVVAILIEIREDLSHSELSLFVELVEQWSLKINNS